MTPTIDYIRELWDFLVYEDIIVKSDVIIGFGSNDISVAKRAVELFKEGVAPCLLFSGGLGKGTEGVWSQTEAETFRDIAIDCGISPEQILVESTSTNTGENIRFSKELLENQGILVKRAIIVHQPNMGRRIFAAIKMQWPEIEPIIAPANCTLEEYIKNLKETGVDEHELFSNIAGDFQRIDVFAKNGYQIPQNIPNSVKAAFDVLCERGYTKYII